jgi:hypothetical protein
MIEEREREWRQLSAFFEFWVTQFPIGVSRDDPAHPLNYLDVIVAKYGRSKALEGLKQAVGDILESTSGLKGKALSDVDTALATTGLPSISSLRQRYWIRFGSIMKRGRIRNETEYYLLKGMASDLTVDLSVEERARIDMLLHKFEGRAA